MNMKYLKIYEEFDRDGYESHWNKFSQWLSEKDFDLYDGEEDLKNNFLKIVNNDEDVVEEKAEKIVSYMDMKWGVNDGYSEIVRYLESLLMDEI